MASEQAGGLQPVELRHRFFESMFDSVAIRRPGFRIPKFGYENWVGFAAGPFGFYDVAFTANGAVRAGVYLDMQERTATKRLFDDLFAERLAVETAVGRILSWERLDDRRASRIVDYREVRDLDSLPGAAGAGRLGRRDRGQADGGPRRPAALHRPGAAVQGPGRRLAAPGP